MRVLVILLGVVFLVTSSGCSRSKTSTQAAGIKGEDRPENPTLNIKLVNEKKLLFTHAHPMGTDKIDGEVGFVGQATSVEGPNYNVMVKLAWPSPKVCEMTIDYDSKGSPRTLTVSLTGFKDGKAIRDGTAAALPVLVPSGKHKLVVTATCP